MNWRFAEEDKMRTLTTKGPFLTLSMAIILVSAIGLAGSFPSVVSVSLEEVISVAYATDSDSSSSSDSSSDDSDSYCDCTVSSDDSSSSDDKVTICHKPGTPAEHTINVSINAESAHLGHGDTLGVCGVDTEADALVETGTPCTCVDGSSGHWYGSKPSSGSADSLREVHGQ